MVLNILGPAGFLSPSDDGRACLYHTMASDRLSIRWKGCRMAWHRKLVRHRIAFHPRGICEAVLHEGTERASLVPRYIST